MNVVNAFKSSGRWDGFVCAEFERDYQMGEIDDDMYFIFDSKEEWQLRETGEGRSSYSSYDSNWISGPLTDQDLAAIQSILDRSEKLED